MPVLPLHLDAHKCAASTMPKMQKNAERRKNQLKSVSFRRAERLHRLLREQLYDRVSRSELASLIRKHIGAEERTVRKYIGLLLEWGFITRTAIPEVYEVCKVQPAAGFQRVLLQAPAATDNEAEGEEPP